MRDQKELYEALCGAISGRGGAPGWDGWLEQDWLDFASLAEAHGVAPLVYWAFQQGDWPVGMLEPVRTAFSQAYYANLGYSALLLDELERLLQAFGQVKIPVMALKGPALAQELYADPGLRKMIDLDLLVHGRDVEEALRAGGYKLQKAIYHLGFLGGPNRQVPVELHWSLMSSDPAYLDRLWERGCAWQAGPALTLSPMDNLLFLSAHLMLQHAGEKRRLAWFYDIHLLLERYGDRLDWAKTWREAEAAGWGEALSQALQGVGERFGWAHDSASLAHSRAPQQAPSGWKERWTRQAMAGLSWRMRALMMFRLLLPEAAYMQQVYQPKPSWLWPAYYPVRWWRMLREKK